MCLSDIEREVHEDQYFERRCIKNFKKTDGDFIDAGCFDGRECIRFLKSELNNNAGIHAFEPDGKNYLECNKSLIDYKNIKIYDLGLSDSQKEEMFLSEKGEKARVTREGNCSIKLDTIDHLMDGKKLGLLKWILKVVKRRH